MLLHKESIRVGIQEGLLPPTHGPCPLQTSLRPVHEHTRDTAHVTVTVNQPHSLNSENHDGWIILAFVDSKGFLKD